MYKLNKFVIIFFLLIYIQIIGCSKWVLIWSKPEFNDYYFDKSSITYLDDEDTFEVMTKRVFFNHPGISPDEDLPWDYALDKLAINCKTGQMKSIESIVYYTNGTNSGWNKSEKPFFIPKSDEVTYERDFICSHK